MSSRWVLVYAVDPLLVGDATERLGRELGAVVASEPGRGGTAVLSLEVAADPEVVVAATQVVRSVDPSAERLHDVVVTEPPSDHEPVTVFVEYDLADEPDPCEHCAGWRHDVGPGLGGEQVLREWHRATCPTYAAWL